METKPINVKITFIVGAPGSGKGILGKILAAKLNNAHHLSVGDHLRDLTKSPIADSSPALGGLTQAELQHYLSTHQLVPPENIVRILLHKISIESSPSHFLIDGFPRDQKSGWMFEHALAHDIERVIFFDCPKQACKERFLGRRREAADSDEVFEKRYGEFEENNWEILKRYRNRLVRVDSSGAVERTKGLMFAALKMEDE